MISKIKKYFSGVVGETKQVTWPGKKQVINHTVLVILGIFVLMIIFGTIDLGFSKLLEYFIATRS